MKTSGPVDAAHVWRVCHVTSGHNVTDTRIFRRECMLLREHGFDISLMAQHAGPEVLNGIRINSLPSVGVRWYQRLVLLLPILFKLLIRRYHITHFHDPDLLPIMLMYSLLTRRPVVWDAHENYECVIAKSNKLTIPALSRMAAAAYGFMELRACRLAKSPVVTVSEPMAERYRAAGIVSVACANYIDHRHVPYPPKIGRANPPLIIMTGTMQGDTFETELVEAFSILKNRIDSRLAFWGAILPSARDAILKRARELGVSDAVDCSGPFPWDRLVTHLIPQSSVAVYLADPSVPQFRDEIPNRLFEYWANGVPTVVANGTLCGELVAVINGGIAVDYGSADDLVTTLESLLKNPDLIETLGKNGRRAVLENWNWEKEGSKLIGLYYRVLQDTFPEAVFAQDLHLDTYRTVPTPSHGMYEQNRRGAYGRATDRSVGNK